MVRSKVAERVSQALLEDERTSDYAISVADDNGVITLTGEVNTAETREAAGTVAEAEEGVIEVINDLSVESEEGPMGGIRPDPFPTQSTTTR